ncbi:hypothetical protein M9Y10_031504 [Tritrichomonas musculus]|uniref:Right handed beta helix domain-containing protein n=1 Tax=Tritrichomonas musculus TaxID=1915356 RepID=A0ABR2H1U4_9EUKA
MLFSLLVLLYSSNFNKELTHYNHEYSNIKIAKDAIPPTPERTPHQGSADTYINKEFQGSIPVSDNNQIQLGNTDVKQISGCRFTDLDITNRVFFIKVNSESSIFDNIFERTSYTTGKTGCIWYAYSSNNKFIISNCKFIKISGKDGDASVLNVNANTNSHIVFQDCLFEDCGEKGNDRPIVNVLEKESTIEFYNCNFSYEEPQISRVLELKGNGATFDNCRFNNCGQNSIDLGIEEVTISNNREFQFTNNHVKSVNTRFINAPRIRAKPTISNNIFESCTLNDEYFIYILHNQEWIEFKSNTFENINSRGTSNGNCGGISTFVERSGSKFKLTYDDCHFINVINEHTTHPMNQGGAIQYFSTSNFEVDIEILRSEFKMNKAVHHGGAVSIQTSGNVYINECTFEMNEANHVNTRSRLLYENYYDEKTNGFGGAIYLNPTFNNNGADYNSVGITISGCTFSKNRGYQGYAIYIEGSTSSTTYNITSNNFNNNYGSENSPETNGIIATEVLLLTKETIEGSNTFTNNEHGSNAEKFMRVDHKGKLLVEGSFAYGDENITQLAPDRIEKELDILSTDEVSVKVTVVVSTFSTKVHKDGGAIHLINCALECTGTTFDKCQSPDGGGGGIFIENSGGKENNANLNKLTFNGCEARYGGAIYIYSSSSDNIVQVSHCTFTDNRASATSSDGTELYGGGAIFLSSRRGKVVSNTFNGNEGGGGVLKIYNVFTSETKSSKLMKLFNADTLSISECTFDIGKKSDCCLFYVCGGNGANVELLKCKFNGNLQSGFYYINGKTIANNGPKLFVKKCTFAQSSAASINLKDYMEIDLKDQLFNFEMPEKTTNNLSFTTWMIIAAACVVAIIAVIVITVFVVKRKNPNQIEENEMSTEVNESLISDSIVASSLI